MDAPAPFDADALLAEAAAHTMRAIRVVSRVMEVEQAAIEVAAAWLPATHRAPASLAEAADAGRAADAITAATGPAAPRLALLSRAMDRLTRSLRYTIALKQRLAAGWPRPRAADDRPAMLRRQVARGVTSRIRDAAGGEAAERLFSELYARLDDPALADDLLTLPVEEIVRRICRDLGLVATALPRLAAEPAARPARESG